MRPYYDYPGETPSWDEIEQIIELNHKRQQAIREQQKTDDMLIAAKTRKIRKIVIGVCSIIAIPIAVWAAVNLLGSVDSIRPNTAGKTFSIEIDNVGEGAEVLPGTTQTLEPVLKNTSGTEDVYGFFEFQYNDQVYEIVNVSEAWELVYEEDGRSIYSYSSSGTMNEIESGSEADFAGELRVKVTGSTFKSLSSDNDNFKVKMIAHGISNRISRNGKDDAWADFEDGGNSSMIAAME